MSHVSLFQRRTWLALVGCILVSLVFFNFAEKSSSLSLSWFGNPWILRMWRNLEALKMIGFVLNQGKSVSSPANPGRALDPGLREVRPRVGW